MKLVTEDFGKDESKITLAEAIQGALEHAEMDTLTEGTFFLVFDTKDRTSFITNEEDRGQAAFILEQAKLTIMGAL